MKFYEPPVGTVVYAIKEDLESARVIDRPNRFLVNVKLHNEVVKAHIHDPGRLKELIFPGAEITVRRTHGIKTEWSVTTALLKDEDILLDTRFHNDIASKFMGQSFRTEVVHGDSRYDFAIDHGFIEVKGCSMQVGKYVIFPDAPTKRGVKHLTSLAGLKKEGFDCNVLFLIFRKGAESFYPNVMTDPLFEEAFLLAIRNNVHMFFPKVTVKGNDIVYCGRCVVGKNPFQDEDFLREYYKVVHDNE